MATLSRSLFVTRYFWPELIGSAPFATDIAEWLARDGAQTTVLSGLPHYPSATVFPAYRDGKRRRIRKKRSRPRRACRITPNPLPQPGCQASPPPRFTLARSCMRGSSPSGIDLAIA